MPVDAGIFFEIKDSFFSTYPANIAVKSAELQSKELAKKYLRRLREAAAAERKHIHELEVQAELASEVGVNKKVFIENIKSGEAEKEFEKDLELCRRYNITGFPTFLIKTIDGKEYIIHGYVSYEVFSDVIESIAKTKLRKRKIKKGEEEVIKFIENYKKVATQEIATLFEIPKEEAYSMLSEIEKKNRITKKKAGNDFFWNIKG